MKLKNFKVLYVEDSVSMQALMKKLLINHTKRIYLAKDGEEGLELFIKHQPDIIISDIHMPNMNGLEMCKIIKATNKNIPIVLLTQFDKIENLKEAIELGIKSFVSKPLDHEKIISTLENIAIELQQDLEFKRLKDLELQEEKIHLMTTLLKEIGHHWRQPLSYIMSVSSSYEFKKRANAFKSMEEEIEEINSISDNVEELSNIIDSVQQLDIDSIDKSQIEKLIRISAPIYSSETVNLQ